MKYNAATLQYFETAPHCGELSGFGVFRGVAGERSQGTRVQFDVKLSSGVIETARFLAFACPHTIAVSAWVAEQAAGRTPSTALPESVHALLQRFAVPVEKLGRLLIVEDAWAAAIRASLESLNKGPHLGVTQA
jgi:NifU-like protein involved in Fe-S cluster formation